MIRFRSFGLKLKFLSLRELALEGLKLALDSRDSLFLETRVFLLSLGMSDEEHLAFTAFMGHNKNVASLDI